MKQKKRVLLFFATLSLYHKANEEPKAPAKRSGNMSTQHIATLLGATCCLLMVQAPAKGSQHVNVTYRNVVNGLNAGSV